jgi:hypothetical protein
MVLRHETVKIALWRHAMTSFDAAHAAVHYPSDRRFRIWIRPSFLIAAALLALLPPVAAWIEFLVAGLAYIPPVPQVDPNKRACSPTKPNSPFYSDRYFTECLYQSVA